MTKDQPLRWQTLGQMKLGDESHVRLGREQGISANGMLVGPGHAVSLPVIQQESCRSRRAPICLSKACPRLLQPGPLRRAPAWLSRRVLSLPASDEAITWGVPMLHSPTNWPHRNKETHLGYEGSETAELMFPSNSEGTAPTMLDPTLLPHSVS